MLRKIAAVVVGTVLAIVLIIVVEELSHRIYPPPADLDVTDKEALKAYLGSVPTGALLFVGAAWVIGTFGGGMLATFIARRSAVTNCAIIGGLVLAGTVLNLASIPHPAWFVVLSIIAIIATTFITSRIAQRFVRKQPAELSAT
jgi:hypothetical protein